MLTLEDPVITPVAADRTAAVPVTPLADAVHPATGDTSRSTRTVPVSCALTIMVVTYNSARLIGQLIDHLQPGLQAQDAELLVVDNASHDGTADLVATRYPWVNLVRSRENLGFAAGNNLGARHARGQMLLMLNPDALPAPGAIEQGMDLMAAHPEVGLGGGLLIDVDGRHQPSARMFPSLFQEFAVLSGLSARYLKSRLFGRLDRTWADPQLPARIDWVPGAFAFMSADLFREIGGFDERFFLYYEEVDLCRRIQARGLHIQYWPQLRIEHIGGESARTVEGQQVTGQGGGAQLTLWRIRSGLLYYRKNHGWLTAWAVNRLEKGWHRLRAVKAQRDGLPDKAAESLARCAVLAQAWDETMGGRVSPPRPW